MNKGKPIVFSLPLHRRLAIIDISGVLSFFELVSYLRKGYLANELLLNQIKLFFNIRDVEFNRM